MPRRKTEGVRKKKPATKEKDVPVLDTKAPFPIVAIGASAGGLEAFEQFFAHTPPDTGMAYVLIQHLDPKHKSILSELIRRFTRMTVHEVEDGMAVEPNTIYVIPPNRNMALLHGILHLLEPLKIPGVCTPIDFFFRSLAEDQKEKAICIVLSGTGTEGTLGLRTVKGEGGMVMVQDPESAKYDGMPRNAIATGLADYILAPEKMPEQLISYLEHPVFKLPNKEAKLIPKENEILDKVFILIRSQTGHDFSHYKHNTILRRIQRKMAVHQITKLSDYVRYLQEDHRELETLFKELIIGVTNFFRDKDAFDALKEKVIPRLFEQRPMNQPVRIWIPGCATGEEAYSIAMLCRDFMDSRKKEYDVQIFATDIGGDGIETARQGLYPENISVDVPHDVLERHFKKEDSFFRVKKEIRDMMVFAVQNLISDPPFSNMDLVSCRNLLIYLSGELQKKVLPLFHYSLRKGGFLFLGSSETIGELSDDFSVVDRKWKLFQRQDTEFKERPFLELAQHHGAERRVGIETSELAGPPRKPNLRQAVEAILLNDYAPTAAIINEKNEILFIQGRAGKSP